MNIIAVTGGRDFANLDLLFDTLDLLQTGGHALHPLAMIDLLVHGGCSGADMLAERWASETKVQTCEFHISKPMWRSFGKSAGPRRNRLMLEVTRPNLLVAFPGGSGTANCVKTARELGIEVLEVKP